MLEKIFNFIIYEQKMDEMCKTFPGNEEDCFMLKAVVNPEPESNKIHALTRKFLSKLLTDDKTLTAVFSGTSNTAGEYNFSLYFCFGQKTSRLALEKKLDWTLWGGNYVALLQKLLKMMGFIPPYMIQHFSKKVLVYLFEEIIPFFKKKNETKNVLGAN